MIAASRTVVVIPPSPPWWHAHRSAYAYMLCTDPLCEKPYDLTDAGEDKRRDR